MRVALALAIACLAAASIVAAPEANPVSSAFRADMDRYEKNLVAGAEAMPPDRFATKPTAQQMTFGELVRHVAASNTSICSWIGGQAPPNGSQPSAASGKDALVDALKRSFAHCRTALASVDDSKLGEEVPFFGGRKVTRAAAMLDLTADWADHYSLMATELRLAGQLPPTARREGKGEPAK